MADLFIRVFLPYLISVASALIGPRSAGPIASGPGFRSKSKIPQIIGDLVGVPSAAASGDWQEVQARMPTVFLSRLRHMSRFVRSGF